MNLGIPELLILLLILLMVFGAGRIPQIAKNFGTGIREFKKTLKDEDQGPGNTGRS